MAELNVCLQGYHYSRLYTRMKYVCREDGRLTEFAEILHVLCEDIIVKLFAVSNGEKDRIESADCAYIVLRDRRERNAGRGFGRHEGERCRTIGSLKVKTPSK